ncbi:MAG TPA: SpoIIE family protein phosphatase, partial [Deinococcales bacterium]|nr:SpoIIE family protein phosphatase [Deinococcales bacterium]
FAGVGNIVATELATNLARHARGGYLLARLVSDPREARLPGLELLAVDRGPGLPDVARSLRDGYSTGGTPGTGLGAVRRLSQVFDIHGLPERGTTVLSRLYRESRVPSEGAAIPAEGVVCMPNQGEEAPGDGWAVHHAPGRSSYLVVDGLGHGPQAAEAALEAVRVFRENPGLAPADLLGEMHGVLRATRGAAVAVAAADWTRRSLLFAGVGNIVASILSLDGSSRSLMSHNGIVGHQMRKVRQLEFVWPSGAVLVMHSDGITTRWKPSEYPGLPQRHPALLAAAVHRDHARGRDDATVLVARDPVSPPAAWEGEASHA